MSALNTKLTAGMLALAMLAGFSATQAQASDYGCHSHSQIPSIQPIRLGLKGQLCHGGMQLVFVEPGSFACQLGLQPGDIIFAINRVSIDCADDYFRGLHKAVFFDRGCLKIGIYRPNHCGQLRPAFVKADLLPQMIGPNGIVGAPVQGFASAGAQQAGPPIQGFPGQAGQQFPGQQGPPIQGFQGQAGQQFQGQQFQGQPQQGQQIPGQQFPGQQGPPIQGFQGQSGQQIPGQQFQGQQFQGQPQQGQQIPGQQIPGQQLPGQQSPGQQQGIPQQQGAGQAVQGFTVSTDLLRRSN